MTGPHPAWCDESGCTATGTSGAHRGQPVLADPAGTVLANLYASAAAPEVVLVEVRCEKAVLAARLAYGLGRVLVSLGKSANNLTPRSSPS